jgi:hypothetical protein
LIKKNPKNKEGLYSSKTKKKRGVINGVRGEWERNTVHQRRNDPLCTLRSRCLLLSLSSGFLQVQTFISAIAQINFN